MALVEKMWRRRSVTANDCRAMIDALKRLRVWESQWRDLAYDADDPRGVIPDAEQPPEFLVERDELRMVACYHAARFAGSSSHDAITFADTPTHADNPFNIDRVRLAVAIGEWFRR